MVFNPLAILKPLIALQSLEEKKVFKVRVRGFEVEYRTDECVDGDGVAGITGETDNATRSGMDIRHDADLLVGNCAGICYA